MHLFNANFLFTPQVIHHILSFCSENSYQHADSLAASFKPVPAKGKEFFTERIEYFGREFKNIYSQLSPQSAKQLSGKFMTLNENFINMLERIKFEALGGYPVIYQNIFHYLYEQRYFSFIMMNVKNSPNVLITTHFNAEPKLSKTYLLYNNLYFWSIIGGMHPGILLANPAFSKAVTANTKNELGDYITAFNGICFSLTVKRPSLQMNSLGEIYSEFKEINTGFLNLLNGINNNSAGIYAPGMFASLPPSFFGGVRHMIDEHTAIKEISDFDLSRINIPN